MLILTVERLIEGDLNIVEYYNRAREIWEEILSRPEAEDVDGLATILGSRQRDFERECGGRFLGQEIMAVVGIRQFYSSAGGDPENLDPQNLRMVELVREAFRRSSCSDAKAYVDDLAGVFRLT